MDALIARRARERNRCVALSGRLYRRVGIEYSVVRVGGVEVLGQWGRPDLD